MMMQVMCLWPWCDMLCCVTEGDILQVWSSQWQSCSLAILKHGTCKKKFFHEKAHNLTSHIWLALGNVTIRVLVVI